MRQITWFAHQREPGDIVTVAAILRHPIKRAVVTRCQVLTGLSKKLVKDVEIFRKEYNRV